MAKRFFEGLVAINGSDMRFVSAFQGFANRNIGKRKPKPAHQKGEVHDNHKVLPSVRLW
jgi:hypothetical protein